MRKYKFLALLSLSALSCLPYNEGLLAMDSKLHSQVQNITNHPNKTFAKQSNPDAKLPPLVHDFEEGDLLYGRKEARNLYISSLRTKLHKLHDHKSTPIVVTADTYNNAFVDELFAERVVRGNYTYEVKEHEVEKVCGEEEACKDMARDRIVLYASYMIKRIKQKSFNGETLGKIKDEIIKTFCMNAIDYTKENKKKILFLLDGFECKYINTNKYDNNFTTNELAHIYSHQEALQGTVVFYRNDKITSAPWIASKDWSKSDAKVCETEFTKYVSTLEKISPKENKQHMSTLEKISPKENKQHMSTLEKTSPKENKQHMPTLEKTSPKENKQHMSTLKKTSPKEDKQQWKDIKTLNSVEEKLQKKK